MASGNTPKNKSPLDVALANIPAQFRYKIVKAFLEVKKRLSEGNDESLGLAAGKLCESVLRFLQSEIRKTSTPFGPQIPDFASECRKLIESPRTADVEGLMVVMPRALVFIYTLRNKRGIGHVGGTLTQTISTP